MPDVLTTPSAPTLVNLLRRPLARMLLLSLSLHAAVVMLVQPRSFPAMDATVVISARLVEETAEAPRPETPPPPPPVLPPLDPAVVTPPAPAPIPPVLPEPAATRPVEPRPPESKPVEPRVPDTPRASEPPSSGLPSIPVMIDTTWYEAKQLDVSPKAARPINPVYPPEASRRGIEGTVKLMLRVDEYGVVKDVEVLEGEPPGMFDQSALDAFRAATFLPARRDRRPVRAQIYIRVRYEMDD